jgi:hypothetical protein
MAGALTIGSAAGAVDAYLEALVARDPGRLPVTAGVRVTENGYPITLGHGLFETASEVTYRHVVVDDSGDVTAVLAVVREEDLLANVAVRLGFDGGRIAEIETVVARRGTASVARPDKLTEPKAIYGQVLDPAERAGRDELIAVAGSYFQAIEADSTDVAFHPECNRTANGQQTTNVGPTPLSCAAQFEHRIFSYITRVRDRRIVAVDEARGLVFGVFTMDVPGRRADFATFPIPFDRLPDSMVVPHTILLAELFKIVGGRIREIEALMVNVPLGATTGW